METLVHIGLSNAVLATLLALLAAAASLILRRPALCHSLWLLVFLKLLTPPLYHVPVPALAPAPGLATEEMVQELLPVEETMPAVILAVPVAKSPDLPRPTQRQPTPAPEPSRTPLSWQSLVAMTWLTGSVSWWIVALYRTLRFHRFLRHAQPAPEDVRDQTRRLASRIGLACCPEVWLVAAPVSPLLWALGLAPRLLLPAGLWARLTEEQRASLLVHELAHLRRRDHWVRRLELVVLGLYWWHPVVWWARRRLQDAEEECCDAWVTWALPDAGPAYASALVETVAFLSDVRAAVPLGASGGGQARHLRRRLTMILNGTTSRKLHALAFVGVLALAAVLLPLAPGSAEPPDEVQVKPRPQAEDPTIDPKPAETKRPDPQAKDIPAAKSSVLGDPQTKGLSTRGQTDRAAANLTEQIEQAQDEVELLKANLEVKRALVAAAEQAFGHARNNVDRLNKLTGTVAAEVINEARQKAEDSEIQLRIRRAELVEPEVRLKQALRRLARLEEQAAKEKRGTSSTTTSTTSTTKDEGSDRLRRLEMQLEAIKKELDALRQELRPKGAPDVQKK
jgi:beta-lactamase regulating signal transducer with metallopeptidase domain